MELTIPSADEPEGVGGNEEVLLHPLLFFLSFFFFFLSFFLSFV